ncbi:hypothetical protein OM076_16375 [Solirubrobacter ginsenosidimutans]|uniref:Uncharacterized protein n=1 Tax=Solirubrobacter ginsenosidimutans TaxID=490573 RepID=A0A9X3S380_9ACTN|nr:hypothetical protein [Solirubrobacter ginsenosidimutans]MDA0161851.1 hypothetical protein [Solirubrobacter ginsenosidimutans]
MGRIALLLSALATIVVSRISWYQADGWHALLLGDPGTPFGLDLAWEERLGDVTTVLGAVALLAAAFPRRAVAGVAAVVLAAGAVFVGAWVLDPPNFTPPPAFAWPAYVAFVAPAIGALAAAWLALRPRGEATAGRAARPARLPRRPRPHSPTPPR